MTIYNDEKIMDINNVSFVNYREQTSFLKSKLEQMTINFPNLKTLMGQKELIIDCFNKTKEEILN